MGVIVSVNNCKWIEFFAQVFRVLFLKFSAWTSVYFEYTFRKLESLESLKFSVTTHFVKAFPPILTFCLTFRLKDYTMHCSGLFCQVIIFESFFFLNVFEGVKFFFQVFFAFKFCWSWNVFKFEQPFISYCYW